MYVAVLQNGAPCTATLTPTQAQYSPLGGIGSFLVQIIGTDCRWSATSDNPDWLVITSAASGSGSGSVTYTASGSSGASRSGTIRVQTIAAGAAIFTVQETGLCTPAINPPQYGAPSAGTSSTVDVTINSGCGWTATSNNPSWLTVTYNPSGTGTGSFAFNAAANTSQTSRTGSITVQSTAGSQMFVVTQEGTQSDTVTGLQFVPVAPCRVMDTRPAQGTSGEFGPPSLGSGGIRTFHIPVGRCSIPTNAQAYSLNVTVVPHGYLGYLTLWPGGGQQPFVSTLNSFDGSIVANAAIVPAGDSGGVSVYVTDPTDVVIDINGYFTSPSAASYAFYAATPCRVVDTRESNAGFGGPIISAGQSRDFSVPDSSCSPPDNATAYSLNATVVPNGVLNYLCLWPTGQAQPYVSTLNSLAGKIVANAAIVPAGSYGGVSAMVTDASHLVLDLNGYFAPQGFAGALSFHNVTPCRIMDTRNANGPFGGPVMTAGSTRTVAVPSSACNIPATAQAYSLNVTVVPQESLGYLTVWPADDAQPFVSTLNSLDARVLANAAIVPAAAGGSIKIYVTNRTHVIVDINGYFAP